MEQCLLLRYGELSLRGKNRRFYEDVIETNVRNMMLLHSTTGKIKRYKGRMVVISENNLIFLKRTCGAISISPAFRTKRSGEEINEVLIKKIKGTPTPKFADKGKEDAQLTDKLVTTGEKRVFVDIYPDSAFIYAEKIKAVGGLPVGSEGTLKYWIESKKDVLAVLLLMKRGCNVEWNTSSTIDISILETFGLTRTGTTKKQKNLLNPTIGMDEKDIEDKLEWFKSL